MTNEITTPSFGVGTQSPREVYNRDRWIETPINMGYGQLTGSSVTLYTAPSGTIAGAASQKALLLEIWLCNTDTAARTVTLYAIESGGAAADNRAIYKDFSIAAKTSVRQECYLVLESGSTLAGLADTTLKVTYRFSGKTLT